MFNLGPMEILVVVVIALVVLGPQRLPEAMRQVGKGVSELRRYGSALTSEVQSAFVPSPGSPAPAAAAPAAPVDASMAARDSSTSAGSSSTSAPDSTVSEADAMTGADR